VKFSPPLPEWKQEAIYKMPMSVYTQIYLKFPKKFWDNKEYILFATKGRRRFPVLQDLDRPGMYPGSGLLLVTVTSNEGRRIERQSFEETKKEVMDMLKDIYGNKTVEPTDIFYSRWFLNPYFRGAYSEGTVGASDESVKNLAKNLEKLYFSGEATDPEWYGYMQGAHRTGEMRAKEIAQAIKCKETGKECPRPSGSSTRITAALNVVLAAVLALLNYN